MFGYGELVYAIKPRLHRYSHTSCGIHYAICGHEMLIAKKASKRRLREYGARRPFLTWCKECCKGPDG